MSEATFNLIKKLIVGLLLLVVLLAVLDRVSGGGHDTGWLREQMGFIGETLVSEVRVPFWVLAVIFATSVPFWFGLLHRLRRWDKLSSEEVFAEDYRSDNLLGVPWQWEFDEEGEVSELRCICPRCHERMGYRENTFAPLGPVTVATCSSCGFTKDLKGKQKQVFTEVKQQIDQKLREGTFVQVIRSQRAAAGETPEARPPRAAKQPRIRTAENPFTPGGATAPAGTEKQQRPSSSKNTEKPAASKAPSGDSEPGGAG